MSRLLQITNFHLQTNHFLRYFLFNFCHFSDGCLLSLFNVHFVHCFIRMTYSLHKKYRSIFWLFYCAHNRILHPLNQLKQRNLVTTYNYSVASDSFFHSRVVFCHCKLYWSHNDPGQTMTCCTVSIKSFQIKTNMLRAWVNRKPFRICTDRCLNCRRDYSMPGVIARVKCGKQTGCCFQYGSKKQ